MKGVNSGEILSSWEIFSPHAHDPVKNIWETIYNKNPSFGRGDLLVVLSIDLNHTLLTLYFSGMVATDFPSEWLVWLTKSQWEPRSQESTEHIWRQSQNWLDILIPGGRKWSFSDLPKVTCTGKRISVTCREPWRNAQRHGPAPPDPVWAETLGVSFAMKYCGINSKMNSHRQAPLLGNVSEEAAHVGSHHSVRNNQA